MGIRAIRTAPETTVMTSVSADVGDRDENVFREGDVIWVHHPYI